MFIYWKYFIIPDPVTPYQGDGEPPMPVVVFPTYSEKLANISDLHVNDTQISNKHIWIF